LLRPEVVALRAGHVAVETADPVTIGRTVIDVRTSGTPAPNAWVALDADRASFVDLLVQTFGAGQDSSAQ
jgi:inosine-uridine nucleoside N-ribohydrolase